MRLKLKICHIVLDKTKKPIVVCDKIDVTIPDLPVDPKNPFPGKQVIPPALKSAKTKGLSGNTEKDIHTLARLVSQSSEIQSPELQREFAAFARNSIKHFKLPEGISLRFEEE